MDGNSRWRGECEPRLALSYRECADRLGVCERTVWQLVRDQDLKAVRIGRCVRIPVSELERFLTDRCTAGERSEGGK